MEISVIGTGYVGLTTGVCLAQLGHTVVGYDKDLYRIEKIQRGISPIFEPGLQELLQKTMGEKKFRATSHLPEAVQHGRILFLCVGTPQLPDGRADLTQIEGVVREIAPHLKPGQIVVEKSTVPVKTARRLKHLLEIYGKKDVTLLSNPEFLREGNAIEDFLKPDRIVIGAEDSHSAQPLLALYESFPCPKIVTDLETAEIIKHAANSFLATKISFINMIADLCDKVGADIEKVAEGIGLDPRIGKEFLKAGLGYGGYCLPKDLRAFLQIAKDQQVDFSLLEVVDRINEERPYRAISALKEIHLSLSGKTFVLFGLSFKPNTDDIREARSLKLTRLLLEEGSFVRGYDPKAGETFLKALGEEVRFTLFTDPYSAVKDAHGIILVTEWEEFKNLDWETIRKSMVSPVLLDGRNYLSQEKMVSLGFLYRGVGRGKGWLGLKHPSQS